MDILKEMPRVTTLLELTAETLPHFSTVCARKKQFRMANWRAFFEYSIGLHQLGEVHAIDEIGVNRTAASQHYAKRTNYTFKTLKTTVLGDCETSAILDIHCLMKQPHDTQVGWQLLTRNLDKLSTVTADKGYNWELLRQKLPAEDVGPLI